jgi:hypothetical protein
MLLGMINSLRTHGCRLRYIDSPISVDERVSSWKQRGEPEEVVESFRAEFTLLERTPIDCTNTAELLELNLSLAKLRFIDLSPFLALERLRCAGDSERMV